MENKMENKMEIFRNSEFGSVRIIQEGEKYLFCGSDVAKALGYTRPNEAVSRHAKGTLKRRIPTNGGVQEMLFVSEGDVYRLITHSKLPSAERFEKWVFDEVIPSIRKHGAYMTGSTLEQVMESPELVLLMAQRMLEEKEKRDAVEQELSLAKPKADFYDAFIHPESCTNLRATAKELKVPEKMFTAFLIRKKYLYRAPSGNLMPYAKPFADGLFYVKDYIASNGHAGEYTLVTPRGKLLFLSMRGEIA